jgi:hypothetical protein
MTDIIFFCACGQKFRAPSSFAGKKLRCSQCGGKVPIPFLEPPAAPSLAAPPLAVVDPLATIALDEPPMAAMVDDDDAPPMAAMLDEETGDGATIALDEPFDMDDPFDLGPPPQGKKKK